jgi:hypothetical protein
MRVSQPVCASPCTLVHDSAALLPLLSTLTLRTLPRRLPPSSFAHEGCVSSCCAEGDVSPEENRKCSFKSRRDFLSAVPDRCSHSATAAHSQTAANCRVRGPLGGVRVARSQTWSWPRWRLRTDAISTDSALTLHFSHHTASPCHSLVFDASKQTFVQLERSSIPRWRDSNSSTHLSSISRLPASLDGDSSPSSR